MGLFDMMYFNGDYPKEASVVRVGGHGAEIVKGTFRGYFNKKNINEYYNLPRQLYPENYIPNGYIDILKPKIILNSKFLNGKKILPFVTEETNDIDDLNDFKKK